MPKGDPAGYLPAVKKSRKKKAGVVRRTRHGDALEKIARKRSRRYG